MTLVALGLVAVALPVLTVGLLRPHLVATFAELCGARFRGDFWVTVSTAGLLSGPAICALVLVAIARRDQLGLGVALLQGSSGGLVAGLGAVSGVVLGFTNRLTRGVTPPPARLAEDWP